MSHKNINKHDVFIESNPFITTGDTPILLTKTEESIYAELTQEWKTARDIRAALPDLSYHTINNALVRLGRRGMIEGQRNEKLKIKEWRKKE